MARNRGLTRWFSWFALATTFAISCWFLSQWQFARADEVQRANQIVLDNYDRAPVPLAELLSPTANWNPKIEYRQVQTSGSYLVGSEYLIRNRPNDGNPGFLQLVAFRTTDNKVIWIDRGWLPTGNLQDSPDYIPKVTDEPRTLVLRLRPNESKLDRGAPKGQLPSIDLQTASADLGSLDIYRQAYGRLVSETPKLPKGVMLPMPELNQGNHLSYAMQWLLFALMAYAAVYWTIAQERRRTAGLAPRKLKILTKDVDAEVEDRLLD